MRKASISLKISSIILPIILAAMVLLTAISYFSTKLIINDQIKSQMNDKLSSDSEMIQRVFENHGRIAETLGKNVESVFNSANSDNYVSMIKNLPDINSDTLGVGIWFEPYKFNNIKYFGPYAYKDNGNITVTFDYCTDEYDYPNQEWYKNGINTKNSIGWTQPYYDSLTNITMITAAVPLYDSNKNFLGIVTADMDLTNLQKNIDNIKFGETGKAFLIDKNGDYITNDDKEKIMKKKIQEEDNTSLADVGKKMLSSDVGETSYSTDGIVHRIFFKAVPNTDIIIGLSVSEKELYMPLNSLLFKSILISAFVIIILGFITVLAIKSKTNSLNYAVSQLNVIAKGKLNSQVPEKFLLMNDEAGDVARAVKEMQESFRELIMETKEIMNRILSNTRNLKEISSHMHKGSNNVSVSIQEVAVDTSGQVQELITISNFINDFSNMIDKMLYEIKDIDYSSNSISDKANYSNEKMQALITSINKISNSFKNFEKKVDILNDNLVNINGITEMINSVAEQTNLLALNASIEAARAGESGKGFSVVAEEIRNLAEQSKDSSENIRNLIGNISQNMNDIINMSGDMDQEVIGQVEVVNLAINSYKEIIKEINNIIPKIESINNSTHNINSDKESITNKIEMLSSVSQEISGFSGKIATSSKEMNEASNNVAGTAKTLEEMTDEMIKHLNKFEL